MKVIATITAKFGDNGYSGIPVSRVADYAIDSSLDTDADQFTVTIGDPKAELVNMFKRDSEIRIALQGSLSAKQLSPLLRGFVDTAGLTHDGTLTLTGRDWSAIAIDDTALPFNGVNIRPEKFIPNQAKTLKFSIGTIPDRVTPLKTFYTDGSESIWAFWYRMVRNRQMWIWCDAIGRLNIDKLNYGSTARYYFGSPTKKKPHAPWIPISEAAIQKNTQTRVWRVLVYGDTGLNSFKAESSDPKISDWLKRPTNIILSDTAIINKAAGLKEAHEQIFEGIVGELEYLIRIHNPGYVVQQNQIAEINIPQMGISGEFFIVGVRLTNGPDGAIQEIRLREKHYALTQRIPQAPGTLDNTTTYSNTALGTAIGANGMGEFFVAAAKHFHGGWDFDLFLAALLGIADFESSIRNIREGSDVVYTQPPPNIDVPHTQNVWSGIGRESPYAAWVKEFANAKSDQYNPFRDRASSSGEAGVGPMQLTSADLKLQADRHFGVVDEFVGGRWDAASNIWIAASYLISLANTLQLPQTGTGADSNIWIAVAAYHTGAGGLYIPGTTKLTPNANAYMKKVRQIAVTSYLKTIAKAIQSTPTNPQYSGKRTDVNGILIPQNSPRAIRFIMNYAAGQIGEPFINMGTGNDYSVNTNNVYVPPVANGTARRRTDLGVDFQGSAGQYVYAIGNATIVYTNLNSSGFGNYIIYQLSEGPYANQNIYVGHASIHAGLGIGSPLTPRQIVADLVPVGFLPTSNVQAGEDYWTEIGYTDPAYTAGHPSGATFADFLLKYFGIGPDGTTVEVTNNNRTVQGFDSSGLVFAAYNYAGLSDEIGGRKSSSQYWNNGKGINANFIRIPKDQLLAGDMVFFDSGHGTPPTSMGLYFAENQIIIASQSRKVVSMLSIPEVGIPYVGALRLKNVWPIDVTQNPVYAGRH